MASSSWAGNSHPIVSKVFGAVDDSVSEKSLSDSQMIECSEYECDQQQKLCIQAELNGLVRDLNLPKNSSLILGSRLKEKLMLHVSTLVSCVDATGPIEKLGPVYNPSG